MIQLNPLSPAAFDAYRYQAAEEYQPLAAAMEQRMPSGAPLPGSAAFNFLLPEGLDTPGQRLYAVCRAGQPAGVLWLDLRYAPKAAILRDLWIDPELRRQGAGVEAMQALEALLRQEGVQQVMAEVPGEHAAARALLARLDYHPTNLMMLREIDQPRPPQTKPLPAVMLEPISEAAFQAYLEQAIRDYAEDKVAAGNWKAEDALERSRQEYAQFLPQGRQTPEQFLYSIRAADGGADTGVMWWGPLWDGKLAYLYDFVVHPAFRGQGYAKAALRALEEQVRAAGLARILLHVFAHNQTARGLYEKAGYWNCDYSLMKLLGSTAGPAN